MSRVNGIFPLARQLVSELPDRFLLFSEKGKDTWILRDRELTVFDLRSDDCSSVFGFIGPLCVQFGVDSVSTPNGMTLEEAMFTALIAKARTNPKCQQSSWPVNRSEILIKQFVNLAPSKLNAYYNHESKKAIFTFCGTQVEIDSCLDKDYLNSEAIIAVWDLLSQAWQIEVCHCVLSNQQQEIQNAFELRLNELVDADAWSRNYVIFASSRIESLLMAAITCWALE